MGTDKEKTWLQCMNCGHIYIIDRNISIEKSIVKASCPECEYMKALNCGHSENDVLELYDPYLDYRYF